MQLYSDDASGGSAESAFGWHFAPVATTRAEMTDFETRATALKATWQTLYEQAVGEYYVPLGFLINEAQELTKRANRFRSYAPLNSTYQTFLRTQGIGPPTGPHVQAITVKLAAIRNGTAAAYNVPKTTLQEIRDYRAYARACESKLDELKTLWTQISSVSVPGGGGASGVQLEAQRDTVIGVIEADTRAFTQELKAKKVAEVRAYVDSLLNSTTAGPLKTVADVDDLYEAGVDAVGKGKFRTAMMQVRALRSVSDDVAQPQDVKLHAQRKAIDLKRDVEKMKRNQVAAGGLGGPKGGASALLGGVGDLLNGAGTNKELLIGAGELLGDAAIAGARKLGRGAKIVAKTIGTGIHEAGSVAKTLAESYRDIRKAEFEGAKDVANTVVQALKGVTRPEKTQSAMLAASIREAKEAQARALAHAHAAHAIVNIQAATTAAKAAIAGLRGSKA